MEHRAPEVILGSIFCSHFMSKEKLPAHKRYADLIRKFSPEIIKGLDTID